MKVVTAVRRELRELGPEASRSTLGSSALVLARMLDAGGTADTARTAAARELRETLAAVRAEFAGAAEDRMTEFEQRRQARAAAAR